MPFIMTLEVSKNVISHRVILTRVAGRHGQNVTPWYTTGSPGTGTRLDQVSVAHALVSCQGASFWPSQPALITVSQLEPCLQ